MTDRTKYPRTMNLPWSHSESSDDVWWDDCADFEGKEIVLTEKLDGECTTIYPDGHVHARSIDTSHHPSRSWIKQEAARFAHDIPAGYRICGENVFAYHSIFYTELPSYFFVYGIYDGDRCLSWDDVEELCVLLELQTVPVIHRGTWEEGEVRNMWTGEGAFPTFGSDVDVPSYPDDFTPCEAEGYVARIAASFVYSDFRRNCAKYVRANHVQTDQNWMTRSVIPNLLLQT